MTYHPEHVRARRGRLIAIALALVALAALYWWSVQSGRRRALGPAEPMSAPGAAAPATPPPTVGGPPAGGGATP